MGHSIAQVYAQAGIEVNLLDKDENILTRAKNQIKSNIETLSEFDIIEKNEISSILKRIHTFSNLHEAIVGIEFILEAVSEVPELKRELLFKVAEFCSPSTIIASNTSFLDIFKILRGIPNPERIITHHWYAPPHIIPLVEIGASRKTAKGVISFSVELLERIGKTPILLNKFIPGFIVNRIQNAINTVLYELLIRKIASPEQIDLAIKSSLGVRLPIVGIVQSQDFTGLDLVEDIIKNMGASVAPISERVQKGHLGAKSGIGFYDYKGKTEKEILKKRDRFYLQQLQFLKSNTGFKPI